MVWEEGTASLPSSSKLKQSFIHSFTSIACTKQACTHIANIAYNIYAYRDGLCRLTVPTPYTENVLSVICVKNFQMRKFKIYIHISENANGWKATNTHPSYHTSIASITIAIPFRRTRSIEQRVTSSSDINRRKSADVCPVFNSTNLFFAVAATESAHTHTR